MNTHGERITVPTADELRDDAAQLLPLTAQPGREPAAHDVGARAAT